MVNKRLIIGLASGVLVTTLALAGLAFAQGAAPQAQATASATPRRREGNQRPSSDELSTPPSDAPPKPMTMPRPR